MWTVNLFQVTTGIIGPELDYEDFSWSVELNGTESWSVKLKKSSLPNIDYNYWLAPWWVGCVFCYDGVPIVAGPLLNLPSEDFYNLDISGVGIRGIFARRKVVEELGLNGDWTVLPKKVLGWSNKSLGTIAKYVVQYSSEKKVGGSLPINYPIPEENGTHERNYKGFNVSNLSADAVLTKLSNVRGGPDILFKPRLLAPNRLVFDFWTGTNFDPRIQQFSFPNWDVTPKKNYVPNLRLTTTGAYQTFRVYATGAGQDEGIKMDVVANSAPMQQGFPLLETSIGTSKSEDIAVVRASGIGNLAMNTNKLQEVELHVRADGVYKLGTFWPGDLTELTVSGFITLGSGTHRMRLLAMNGSHDNDVMLNLQSENKFLSTEEVTSLTDEEDAEIV